MLDRAEIGRRIKAARLLRSVQQTELNRLFAEDGLGAEEAGRVERGELPMTRVRRDALTRHLGVPERWFTSESVDEIVGYTGSERMDMEELLGEFHRLARATEEMLGQLGRHIGRRDTRFRAAKGRRSEPPEAVA